jgi:hypothetical protein
VQRALGYHRQPFLYIVIMTLRIAPRGWDHAAWVGSFYPEDLPPEWRLAYFSNEFRAVVVPAKTWWDAEPAALAHWLEEVGTRMRFYLELPERPVTAAMIRRANLLGVQFGGMVTTVGGEVHPIPVGHDDDCQGLHLVRWGGGDLRDLRKMLETLPSEQPSLLIIEGDPPSLGLLRAVNELVSLLQIPS